MSFSIPAIISALSQGYTMIQVLEKIVSSGKPLGKRIKEALNQGHSPDQIGEYLTKGRSRSFGEQQGMLAGMTEKEKGERIANYQPPIERGAIKAVPAIASGVASYALGRAVPKILQQIAPQITQGPIAPVPQGPQAGPQPQPPGAPPPTPTPGPQPIQPQPPPIAPAAPTIPASQVLQQMGVKDRVDSMLKSGNTPEAIAGVLTAAGKKQGTTDPELIQTITQYQKEKPPEPPKPIERPKPIESAKPKAEEPRTEGSLALLPQGQVGEIESVKNGIAKINVDGQIRHRKLSDIEQEPEEIKAFDYKKMAQDYIDSIPETERSTAMLMNYFVPKSEDKSSGEFHVIFPSDPFHIGIYKNVPNSLAEKINSASTAPKTTGETALGKHIAGVADSRGAPMIELRSNAEKYPYEKIPVPYNLANKLFEAIKQLNQDAAKKKSEEKKALKKKEKENEPKKPKKSKKQVSQGSPIFYKSLD